jgi:hypothetical protein
VRIIGITGKAGSGKDTLAAMIAEEIKRRKFGIVPQIYSLATPMKVAVDSMLDFADPDDSGKNWFARENKEHDIRWLGVSPRVLLQTLGTEWGRNTLGQSFWIKIAQAYMSAFSDVSVFIVPDIRFDNEAGWVRDSGQLIHIYRIGVDPVGLEGHESEAGVKYEIGDLTVGNDGQLEELKEMASSLVDKLFPESVPRKKEILWAKDAVLGEQKSRRWYDLYINGKHDEATALLRESISHLTSVANALEETR